MKTKQMASIVVVLAAIIFVIGAPGDSFAKQKKRGFHRNHGRHFIQLQQKIYELETRLSEYEASSANLQTEIVTVREDILDIQEQISQIQANIAEDIKALEENLDQNSGQIAAVRSEIEYLQGLLYEKIAEMFQKVEQAEKELRDKIAILQEQDVYYKNAIEQGQSEIAELRTMLADSIAQLNAVGDKVNVNSGLIAQLQECLNIQNEINEIQGEISSASARILENKLRIDDLEQQIESMPAGHTHQLVMGDAVSGIKITSSTDRYWLFICWAQAACYFEAPGLANVKLSIDNNIAASVAQLGNYAGKRSLSLSHIQLLTKGNHTAKVQLQTSFAGGKDYAVMEKGKIIAIGF
jgi:predicted  nucleic acid-binding Zn-ribbon protein